MAFHICITLLGMLNPVFVAVYLTLNSQRVSVCVGPLNICQDLTQLILYRSLVGIGEARHGETMGLLHKIPTNSHKFPQASFATVASPMITDYYPGGGAG